MGLRGPPRKPTALKVVQGVPGGAKTLNHDEPKPERSKGATPPRWLSRDAKRVWKDAAVRLEAIGLLTSLDHTLLARYCDLTVRWHKARKWIDEKGEVYTVYHRQSVAEVRAGLKPRVARVEQWPQVAMYREFGRELARIEAQFGMSPASRASLHVVPPAGDGGVAAPRNDTTKFLFG